MKPLTHLNFKASRVGTASAYCSGMHRYVALALLTACVGGSFSEKSDGADGSDICEFNAVGACVSKSTSLEGEVVVPELMLMASLDALDEQDDGALSIMFTPDPAQGCALDRVVLRYDKEAIYQSYSAMNVPVTFDAIYYDGADKVEACDAVAVEFSVNGLRRKANRRFESSIYGDDMVRLTFEALDADGNDSGVSAAASFQGTIDLERIEKKRELLRLLLQRR